jgi:hypothetical protein
MILRTLTNSVRVVGTLDIQYDGPHRRHTTIAALGDRMGGLNLCAALQVRGPFFGSFQLRVFFDHLTDGSELLLASIPGDPLLVEGILSSRPARCLREIDPAHALALRVRALHIAGPEPDDEPGADVLLEGRVVHSTPAEARSRGMYAAVLQVETEHWRRHSTARFVERLRIPIAIDRSHPHAPYLAGSGRRVLVAGMLETIRVPNPRRRRGAVHSLRVLAGAVDPVEPRPVHMHLTGDRNSAYCLPDV